MQKTLGRWQLGLSGRDIFGTFNAWSHDPAALREVYNQTGNDLPVNTLEVTLPRWVLGAGYPMTLSEEVGLLLTADLITTFDGRRNTLIRTGLMSVDPTGGLELGFRDMFYFRMGAGQFQQEETLSGTGRLRFRLSGGLGIDFRDLTLDYALTDFGGTSTGLYTHVFSIKIDFHEKAD